MTEEISESAAVTASRKAAETASPERISAAARLKAIMVELSTSGGLIRVNTWLSRNHKFSHVIALAMSIVENDVKIQELVYNEVRKAIDTKDFSFFDKDPIIEAAPVVPAAPEPVVEEVVDEVEAPEPEPAVDEAVEEIRAISKKLGHSTAMLEKGCGWATGNPKAVGLTPEDLTASQKAKLLESLKSQLKVRDEDAAKSDAAPAVVEPQKKPTAKSAPKTAKSGNVVEFPPAKTQAVESEFPIPDVEKDSAGALAYIVLNRLIKDGAIEKVVGGIINVAVANAIATAEPAKSDSSDVSEQIEAAFVPFRKEMTATIAKKIAAALE